MSMFIVLLGSSTFPSGEGFSLPSSRRRSTLPPRQRSVTPSARATTPAPITSQRSDRKRPAPSEPESPKSTSSSSLSLNTNIEDIEIDQERYQVSLTPSSYPIYLQ